MTDNEFRRKAALYTLAERKGVTRAQVDTLLDAFSLEAAEFALQQAKGKQARKGAAVKSAREKLTQTRQKTKQMLTEVQDMLAPYLNTADKGSAPAHKPASDRQAYQAAAKPARSIFGAKAVTVTVSDAEAAAELERRRRILKISDSVWKLLRREMSEQQLYDFLTEALEIEGRTDVTNGQFSKMWGGYIPRGQTK